MALPRLQIIGKAGRVPFELCPKAVDRRCATFSLDDEGMGRRCVERFPEIVFQLCSGGIHRSSEYAARMAIFSWCFIDFEVDVARKNDLARAHALRAFQRSFDPVMDSIPRIVGAAVRAGMVRFDKKDLESSRNARGRATQPSDPTLSASASAHPLTIVSNGGLLGSAGLHILDALARRGRTTPLLARAEEELRNGQARLADLEQCLARAAVAPARRPPVATSHRVKARPRRHYDFSHLAQGWGK